MMTNVNKQTNKQVNYPCNNNHSKTTQVGRICSLSVVETAVLIGHNMGIRRQTVEASSDSNVSYPPLFDIIWSPVGGQRGGLTTLNGTIDAGALGKQIGARSLLDLVAVG